MTTKESAKLSKVLRRLDALFLILGAMIALETLGEVSSFGAGTFTWIILLVPLYLIPYALIMAELGSSFPQEGGPYVWMKLAFGRLPAALGAVMYWITNPIWIGGLLSFAAAAVWDAHISHISPGTAGDYAFKLSFIWATTLLTIISIRQGRWIPTLGAISRIAVLLFFSLTVIIYAIEHGVHGYSLGAFRPGSLALLLGLVPLLLFNYEGFELPGCAAEEMIDPQLDIPKAVVRSAFIAALAYGIPILGIVIVLPKSAITGIGGFMDAVTTTFKVYGPAAHVLTVVMAIIVVFAFLTEGVSWMIGADRTQAVAAMDGAAPPFFGVFSARFGTPTRVNVASGIVATVFMLAAQLFTSASFTVVLYLATSTAIMSYLLMFPAAIALRLRYPDVRRPYRVPFGTFGMFLATALCTCWIVLGTCVALFPGVLEHLFGIPFDFVAFFGVSRIRFEMFTLGTLAAILAIGVACYWLGGPVRRLASAGVAARLSP